MPFRRPAARVLSFFVCALILGALLASPARAVNITVNIGGTPTVFDVRFNTIPGTSGTSFDTDAALIEGVAPWWGDSTLAVDIANAYASQVSPVPFDLDFSGSVTVDRLRFAYSADATFVDSIQLLDDGFVTTATSSRSFAFPYAFYAYVAPPTPVPEIDGGALGQGAVILLAVWLMLRRRLGVA